MVIGKEMGQLPVDDRRQIVGAAITYDMSVHLPASPWLSLARPSSSRQTSKNPRRPSVVVYCLSPKRSGSPTAVNARHRDHRRRAAISGGSSRCGLSMPLSQLAAPGLV